MRFDKLDLNLLVALDLLLTEKSIGRAAKHLNMSQSAMSGSLARLREYFGDDLLVAAGRHLVLTPLAESMVDPVRDILLRIRATVVTQRHFNPATAKRRFTVAVSDYVITVLFGDFVARVQREAPGITFDLTPVGNLALDQLNRGDIDLVIVPHAMAPKAHPNRVLFEDDQVCIAWRDNPMLGRTLTLSQYLTMGHVVPKLMEYRAESAVAESVALRGTALNAEVTVSYFAALPRLVVGTTRIATVLRGLAEIWAEYLPLKLFPVPLELPPFVEVMQWHACHDRDPGHVWLRNALADAAGAMGKASRSVARSAPGSDRRDRARRR